MSRDVVRFLEIIFGTLLGLYALYSLVMNLAGLMKYDWLDRLGIVDAVGCVSILIGISLRLVVRAPLIPSYGLVILGVAASVANHVWS